MNEGLKVGWKEGMVFKEYNSALSGCTGLGTTWANPMHFGMIHVLGARSIAQPVDLHSCVLPLCYNCP